MAKTYSDRSMKVEQPEREFFFPKANPPQTVKAKNREEAEKKLKNTKDVELIND